MDFIKHPFFKAIAAGLATLITVGVAYLVSGELNRVELAIGVTGVISTALVFFTTNVPGWPVLKAVVPALTGFLAAVGLWIETGVLDKGALQVFLTAVGIALLTAVTKNTSSETYKVNELGSQLRNTSAAVETSAEPGEKPTGAVGGKFGEKR